MVLWAAGEGVPLDKEMVTEGGEGGEGAHQQEHTPCGTAARASETVGRGTFRPPLFDQSAGAQLYFL